MQKSTNLRRQLAGANVTTYAKAGLKRNVTYYYRVHAYSGYTDPRIFDLAGAVEQLATLPAGFSQHQMKTTGTDGGTTCKVGRSESVSGQQAGIKNRSAVSGGQGNNCTSALTRQWREKATKKPVRRGRVK